VTVRVRAAEAQDEAFILALNAACEPAVGPLSAGGLADFRREGASILVAEDAQAAACAFAVVLRPGLLYGSDNYAWFCERYQRHLYIDRVAVAAGARRAGTASALYRRALGECRRLGLERLTAEVNVDPPNPVSMRFHEAFGFERLCERPSRSGKRVAMLTRPLEGA